MSITSSGANVIYWLTSNIDVTSYVTSIFPFFYVYDDFDVFENFCWLLKYTFDVNKFFSSIFEYVIFKFGNYFVASENSSIIQLVLLPLRLRWRNFFDLLRISFKLRMTLT
jgi:hypothetical protein